MVRRRMLYPSEDDVELWFEHNYKALGFEKIVRSEGFDIATDFLGFQGGRVLNVELKVESHCLWYQLDQARHVDVLVCHRKDVEFEGVKITEIRSLPKESFCQCYSCQKLMNYKGCRAKVPNRMARRLITPEEAPEPFATEARKLGKIFEKEWLKK